MKLDYELLNKDNSENLMAEFGLKISDEHLEIIIKQLNLMDDDDRYRYAKAVSNQRDDRYTKQSIKAINETIDILNRLGEEELAEAVEDATMDVATKDAVLKFFKNELQRRLEYDGIPTSKFNKLSKMLQSLFIKSCEDISDIQIKQYTDRVRQDEYDSYMTDVLRGK
ncbi:hypothetical protein SAMN06313540_1126 [Epsilonproteobacteria bacterium SCGC AD-308-E02]|nr:hypothetical protein SAMN06313540_1126 [Epsilonproteobacteria bacterium SCGC AD-308-E02]